MESLGSPTEDENTSCKYQPVLSAVKVKQAHGNSSLQLGQSQVPWSIHKNSHAGEETSRDLNLLILHKKLREEIGTPKVWVLLSNHTCR